MLELLLIVVLAGHLLATNLATGGPLLGLWLLRRERRGRDAEIVELGRSIVRASIVALVVAIVLGAVAIGIIAITRPGPFFQAAGRLPTSRYWFGLVELAFFIACLVGYLRLSRSTSGEVPRRSWARGLLLVLAGSDLAYHFPPLLTLIGVMSTERGREPIRFTAAFVDPQVMALVMHFMLASITVAGVYVAWAATRVTSETTRQSIGKAGGRWALAATLGQFIVGVWVLLTLPSGGRDRMLGDDTWAALLFATALLGAVMLSHSLATIALGEVGRSQVRSAAAWLAVVVLVMVAVQSRVRQPLYDRTAGEYVGRPDLVLSSDR